MENIIRCIVRHFVFVLITYVTLYLLVVSFGAMLNFTAWDLHLRVLFATVAHVSALMLHGYWYENR